MLPHLSGCSEVLFELFSAIVPCLFQGLRSLLMVHFCYSEDLDPVNLGLWGDCRTKWDHGLLSTLHIEGLSSEVCNSRSASWRRWVRVGLEGAEELGL